MSDEYENVNDKFSIRCSSTRDTKDLKKIWDIEIVDHNNKIWRKELVCEEPPEREELIKSYWVHQNTFKEEFLTLQEAEDLREHEERANLLRTLKTHRRDISDRRNAAAAHNIRFDTQQKNET